MGKANVQPLDEIEPYKARTLGMCSFVLYLVFLTALLTPLSLFIWV